MRWLVLGMTKSTSHTSTKRPIETNMLIPNVCLVLCLTSLHLCYNVQEIICTWAPKAVWNWNRKLFCGVLHLPRNPLQGNRARMERTALCGFRQLSLCDFQIDQQMEKQCIGKHMQCTNEPRTGINGLCRFYSATFPNNTLWCS